MDPGSEESMTPAEEREHVEKAWEHFRVRLSEPFEGFAKDVFVVALPGFKFSDERESKAIHAAYEFTLAREEEIRQVQQECCTLILLTTNRGPHTSSIVSAQQDVLKRILAVEQARLANLQRGMRKETETV
jgi:hypothetical protein